MPRRSNFREPHQPPAQLNVERHLARRGKQCALAAAVHIFDLVAIFVGRNALYEIVFDDAIESAHVPEPQKSVGLQIHATIVDIPFQNQHEQSTPQYELPNLSARGRLAECGCYVDIADADICRADGRCWHHPALAARERRFPGDRTG